MSRLVLAFCIALTGHYFLLQYHFSQNELPSSQAISEDSVRVTINQYNGNKKFQPSKNLLQTEQKPKEETRKEKKNIVPLTPETLPKVIPPPKQKVQTENKLIKVQKKKISKPFDPPPLPEPKEKTSEETKDAVQEKALEEFSIAPAKSSHAESSKEADVSEKSNSSPLAVASTVVNASPLYAHNPIPEYPTVAKRRHWEGIVTLSVEVTARGTVASIQLLESSGYDILDKTAVQAVKTWRFLAGTVNGKPISSKVTVPVHFTLTK